MDVTDNTVPDLANYGVGRLFHFTFDSFHGYTTWTDGSNDDAMYFDVFLQRTGELQNVKMWKGAWNGGSGDARGRKNSGEADGDWLIGDTIWFQCENYATIAFAVSLVDTCQCDANAYQLDHGTLSSLETAVNDNVRTGWSLSGDSINYNPFRLHSSRNDPDNFPDGHLDNVLVPGTELLFVLQDTSGAVLEWVIWLVDDMLSEYNWATTTTKSTDLYWSWPAADGLTFYYMPSWPQAPMVGNSVLGETGCCGWPADAAFIFEETSVSVQDGQTHHVFSRRRDDAMCTVCPMNSQSVAGSVGLAACTCGINAYNTMKAPDSVPQSTHISMAESLTSVEDWHHVKHLHKDATDWYPENTEEGRTFYQVADQVFDAHGSFTQPFPERFDELLFTRSDGSGNVDRWVWCRKSEIDRVLAYTNWVYDLYAFKTQAGSGAKFLGFGLYSTHVNRAPMILSRNTFTDQNSYVVYEEHHTTLSHDDGSSGSSWEAKTVGKQYDVFARQSTKALEAAANQYARDNWHLFGDTVLHNPFVHHSSAGMNAGKTLVFDFGEHVIYDDVSSKTAWDEYVLRIGGTQNLNMKFASSQGGFGWFGHDFSGYVKFNLPADYNYVEVFYGNAYNTGTVTLQIGGTTVSSCGATTNKTHTQSYTGTPELKIYDSNSPNAGILMPYIKVTVTQRQFPDGNIDDILLPGKELLFVMQDADAGTVVSTRVRTDPPTNPLKDGRILQAVVWRAKDFFDEFDADGGLKTRRDKTENFYWMGTDPFLTGSEISYFHTYTKSSQPAHNQPVIVRGAADPWTDEFLYVEGAVDTYAHAHHVFVRDHSIDFCTACPRNSVATAGSVGQDACECRVGHDMRLTDNLMAWYQFDGNFKDSSGNGNDLQIVTGTPQINTGQYKRGKAVYFDGSSHLETEGFTLHDKPFAIAVWIYQTAASGYLFGQAGPAQGATYKDAKLHIRALSATNDYFMDFYADRVTTEGLYAADLNQWVHIVFQVHSNKHQEIWRNGVLVAEDTADSLMKSLDAPVAVGGQSGGGQMTGYMDDLRFYDRALTESEIQSVMAAVSQSDPYVAITTPMPTPMGTNLARACGPFYDQNCIVTASSIAGNVADGITNSPSMLVDGITNVPLNRFHSDSTSDNYVRIDLGRSLYITDVHLYNADIRMNSAKLWIGDRPESDHDQIVGNVPQCALFDVRDASSDCWVDCIKTCNMKGRYVYLTLDNGQKFVFYELEVYGLGGETPSVALGPNLARQCGAYSNAGCDVQVSSDRGYAPASTITDGVLGTLPVDSTWISADSSSGENYVRIELKTSTYITKVHIYNRFNAQQTHLNGAKIWIGDGEWTSLIDITTNEGLCATISVTDAVSECYLDCMIVCNMQGGYVYVTLDTANLLQIREIEVYGTFAPAAPAVCEASEHDFSAEESPELVCPANFYKTGGCEIVDPPNRDRTHSSVNTGINCRDSTFHNTNPTVAWCDSSARTGEWLQLNFDSMRSVHGLIFKPRSADSQAVTKVQVFTKFGDVWTDHGDFVIAGDGNMWHRTTEPRKIFFQSEVQTQKISIYVRDYEGFPSMKVAVLSCQPEHCVSCPANSQSTAGSVSIDECICNSNHYADCDSLIVLDPLSDKRTKSSVHASCGIDGSYLSPIGWCSNSASGYVTIDLSFEYTVLGVLVARRYDQAQYPTSVSVEVSSDSTFVQVDGGATYATRIANNINVYPGLYFQHPVTARYVRITVEAHISHPSMRTAVLVRPRSCTESSRVDLNQELPVVTHTEQRFPPTPPTGAVILDPGEDNSVPTVWTSVWLSRDITGHIFDLSHEFDADGTPTYLLSDGYLATLEAHDTVVGFSQIIQGGRYEFRALHAGSSNSNAGDNGLFSELFDDNVQHHWFHAWSAVSDATGLWNVNAYNQNDKTYLDDGSFYQGLWVEIGMPRKIILSRYSWSMSNSATPRNERSPEKWMICASNDRATWTVIHEAPRNVNTPDVIHDTPADQTDIVYSGFTAPGSFKYYRWIIRKLDIENTVLAITSWKLYGVPEASKTCMACPAQMSTASGPVHWLKFKNADVLSYDTITGAEVGTIRNPSITRSGNTLTQIYQVKSEIGDAMRIGYWSPESDTAVRDFQVQMPFDPFNTDWTVAFWSKIHFLPGDGGSQGNYGRAWEFFGEHLSAGVSWGAYGMVLNANFMTSTSVSSVAYDHSVYHKDVNPNGVWAHFTLTYISATGQFRYYINNDMVFDLTNDLSFDFPDRTLRFGSTASAGYQLETSISDLRIYDRVLTDTEIRDVAAQNYLPTATDTCHADADHYADFVNFARDCGGAACPVSASSEYVNLARKCGALFNEGCTTAGLDNEHATLGPTSAGVDGDKSTYFYSHYNGGRWWAVDLGQDYYVTNLVYYAHSQGSTLWSRTDNIYLKIATSTQGSLSHSSLSSATLCGGEINGQTADAQKYTRSCPADSIARYVYVYGGVNRLYVGELEVYGSASQTIRINDNNFIDDFKPVTLSVNEYITIDMGHRRSVHFVRVYNRITDLSNAVGMNSARIYVTDEPVGQPFGEESSFDEFKVCFFVGNDYVNADNYDTQYFDLPCLATGRYVTYRGSDTYWMNIRELEVYGVQSVECPALSTAAAGATSVLDCKCQAGYVIDSVTYTCDPCPAGTYRADGMAACVACADVLPNSVVSGTGNVFCECAAGYSLVDESSNCQPCEVGHYKEAAGNESCTECAVGTTVSTGSTAASDCGCDAGYYGNGGVCSVCIGDTYSDFGAVQCTNCPSDSHSLAGTDKLISNCVCNSGFYGTPGLICTQCAVGKYNSEPAQSTCLTCPEFSTSQADRSWCACNAGYHFTDDYTCGACVLNKYKDDQTNSSCTDCPLNAQTSSNASVLVSSCLCIEGTTAAAYGDDCVACVHGKYKDTLGLGVCNDCPTHSTTEHTQAIAESLCVAHAGYYLDDPNFLPCAKGEWKGDIGNHVCTQCPHLTTTATTASTEINDCDVCEAEGYQSTPVIAFNQVTRWCICDVGFYDSNGFTEGIGSGQVCEPCLAGHTCAGSQRTSGAYVSKRSAGDPEASSTLAESTGVQECELEKTGSIVEGNQCVCPIGKYERDISGGVSMRRLLTATAECVPCDFGSYKNSTGSAACTACGAFETTTSTASVAESDCVCGTGYAYELVGRNITMIPGTMEIFPKNDGSRLDDFSDSFDYGYDYYEYGSYNPDAYRTVEECIQLCQTHFDCKSFHMVPKGDIDNVGGYICKLYDATMNLTQFNLDVMAWPDYKTVNSEGGIAKVVNSETFIYACLPCAIGTYKDHAADAACTSCHADATSPAGSDAAQDCDCNAGFFNDSSVCTQCSSGTYKTGVGDEACTQCTSNSDSPAESKASSACQCNVGYTGDHTGCVACLVNEYKYVEGSAACSACPDFSASPAASVEIAACVCNHGYSGVDGALCILCKVGEYENANVCESCDLNAISPAASHAATACECNAGYTGNNGQACNACEAGKYKTGIGSAVCTDCPTSSTSPQGSTELIACACNFGYTGEDGGTCTACEADKYKDSAGNAACSDCPANSSSAVGSTASTDCQCNIGYTGSNGGVCTVCAAGTYKERIGDAFCDSCHENSISPEGSTNATDCDCNAGYYFDELVTTHDESVEVTIEKCEPCSTGKYKMTVGDIDCSDCTANSNSPLGSTASSDCECNAGFEETHGGPCEACSAGKYKAATGSASCDLCPTNSNSPSASTISTNCQCNVGYTTSTTTALPPISCVNYIVLTQPCTQSGMVCPENYTPVPENECNMWLETFSIIGNATNFFCMLEAWPTDTSNCVGNATSSLQNPCYNRIRQIEDKDILNWPSGCFLSMKEEATGNIPGRGTIVRSTGGDGSTTTCSGIADFDHLHVICKSNPLSCGAGYTPNVNTEQCGYEQRTCEEVCTACEVGKFKNFVGDAVCTGCEACSNDYYKDSIGDASCSACPDFSNSSQASTDITDCKCNAGYKGVDGEECGRVCPAGYEATDDETACDACANAHYKAVRGDHDCTPCPANSHHAFTNATSVDTCTCNHGYVRDASWATLAACVACADTNEFNNYAGEETCFGCSDVSSSGTTCSSLNTQTPPAGYQTTADFLNYEVCPLNTYHDGIESDDTKCDQCPVGSEHNLLQQTSIAACVCNKGYGRTDTAQACVECEAGKYKNLSGDGACVDCPTDSTSHAIATALSQCFCPSGYHGADGAACTACIAGQYKDGDGGAPCQNCSSYSNSAPASGLQTDCKCNAGYTGVDGGTCTACAVGKYKPTNGTAPCTLCGNHASTSATASASRSECFCISGFMNGEISITQSGGTCVSACIAGEYLSAGSCVPCVAGSYKSVVGSHACTLCGDPKNSSGAGSDSIDDCVCRVAEMSFNAADVMCVLSWGSFGNDTTFETSTDTTYEIISQRQSFVGDAQNQQQGRLKSLQWTPGSGTSTVQVSVRDSTDTAVVIWSCTQRDCLTAAGIDLPLLTDVKTDVVVDSGQLFLSLWTDLTPNQIQHDGQIKSWIDIQASYDAALVKQRMIALGLDDCLLLKLTDEIALGTDCHLCLPGLICNDALQF